MTDTDQIEWSSSSGSLALSLTLEDAQSGYHQGDCENDVRGLRRLPYVREQLAAWDPDSVRSELREYGAWDENELEDDDMNEVRMLWLACGDIVDSGQA